MTEMPYSPRRCTQLLTVRTGEIKAVCILTILHISVNTQIAKDMFTSEIGRLYGCPTTELAVSDSLVIFGGRTAILVVWFIDIVCAR